LKFSYREQMSGLRELAGATAHIGAILAAGVWGVALS
jgi:hypothetical protein